jgi:hypothetical protein
MPTVSVLVVLAGMWKQASSCLLIPLLLLLPHLLVPHERGKHCTVRRGVLYLLCHANLLSARLVLL